MVLQFAVAAMLSWLVMLIFETWDWQAVKGAALSLLFVTSALMSSQAWRCVNGPAMKKLI